MAIIVMMTVDEHYFVDQNDDDVEPVDKYICADVDNNVYQHLTGSRSEALSNEVFLSFVSNFLCSQRQS